MRRFKLWKGKGKKRPSNFLKFHETLQCNTGRSSAKSPNLNVAFGDHMCAAIVPVTLREPRKLDIYGVKGRRHKGHTSIKAAHFSDRIL
jgi:hypothetical protein